MNPPEPLPADGDASGAAQTLASPPDARIPTEPPWGLADTLVLVAAIVLALGILYRRLWKRRGQCDGCAQGSCPGTTCNGPAARPPQQGRGTPVTIAVDRIHRRPRD
ncbi:hypothetical protein CKO33_05910 [Ectothiorhodospira mobilis]|nr:hypothetical protein [Ectothiorhodospira mobilis]